MKSNVGYSILTDSFSSGVETATKAKQGIEHAKIAFLYTSVKLDQAQVIAGAKSVLGEIPIVGCTSSGGIIVPDGIITGEQGFSGMMILDDESMNIGVASLEANGDARNRGREIALKAIENAGTMKRPSYFYMVASPKEEESYLKGIEDVIGSVPFFGGSAADDAVAGDWKIFCNDQIFSDGCAVIFFYTNKKIVTEYTGAYNETEKRGIITKANGRTLIEIDGEPALTKYASMIGEDVNNLMGGNLLVRAIANPFGVKDPIGSITLIRHPMVGNSDYTMNIGNDLAVGTAITVMQASVDELINSTVTTITELNKNMNNQAAAYLLIHCGGRKLGIGDRLNEVHQNLVNYTNGIPFMTVFTFGEYGYHDHSANSCGGLMLSFTGFSK